MRDTKLPNALMNVPDNFLSRLDELEIRIEELETAPAAPYEDIVGGRLTIADLILSPAADVLIADPTSTDYTGAFMAGEGITFDAVDYVIGNVINGVLKTGFTSTGTLYATDAEIEGTIVIGAGSAGGWLIDATTIYSLASDVGIILDSSIPAIKVGDTGGDHIIIDGANQRIRSSNFVAGASGSNWDTATGDMEINNLIARGMIKTAVFQKDVISSIGGSLLVLDSDVLAADMTAADNSTLTIQGTTTFAVGDILRMKDEGSDEWFEVTNIAGAPTYVVTRDKEGSYAPNANPAWTKGQAVVNYRQSGDGGVILESGATPKIKIFTHAGSPWTTITDHIVFQEDKAILQAKNFPSQVHIEWQADDTAETVGKILGFYSELAAASGLYLIGQEKDVDNNGTVGMVVQGYDQSLGDFRVLFDLDSNGEALLFLEDALEDTAGAQGLVIGTLTSETDAGNTILYLDTKSKGTAAAGLGTAVAYRIEDAGGFLETAGYHGVFWTDATNGSEDAKFAIGLMKAGALTDAITIDSTGVDIPTASVYKINGKALWTPIPKPADESTNTDTSLNTDTDLRYAIPANGYVAIRGRIWYTTPAAADFQFRFIGGTATLAYMKWAYMAPGTTTLTAGRETAFPGATNVILGTTTEPGYIEFDAIILADAGGDTFGFQWAQQTSNGSNTTVLKGSYIEYVSF